MRHPPSTLHFSQLFRSRTELGAIEWEELPSLAGSLAARLIVHGSRQHADGASTERDPRCGVTGHSAWDATCPAAFETSLPERPFLEPVSGVSMREVHEPDVFRHFFGA